MLQETNGCPCEKLNQDVKNWVPKGLGAERDKASEGWWVQGLPLRVRRWS